MSRLSFDCEELLHWWEPKADISFIFNFNWRSLQQLREAITIFMSARLHAVSQRALVAVSESGCPRLKMMIASNPQTPADLLAYLTEVSTAPVLVRVAENPSVGKDTLSRLAFHEDPEVRAAVAENPNTPESCFKRLAHDESADVRYRIAESPQAPVASLYMLLKDENPYVSQRARQTLARILSNTITVSERLMAEDTEMRPNLTCFDMGSRIDTRLIEELNDICGCDFTAPEFSVPEIQI